MGDSPVSMATDRRDFCSDSGDESKGDLGSSVLPPNLHFTDYLLLLMLPDHSFRFYSISVWF